MFERAVLKQKAMTAFKRNYWLCVVVALILAWAAGSSAGYSSSSARRYTSGGSSSSYDYSDIDSFDEFIDAIEEQTHGDVNEGTIKAMTGMVIVITLIIYIISLGLFIFIKNPLMVGCKRYFTINAFQNPEFKEVGFAFKKEHYMNIVKVEFMKNLFIFLWSLLLIIPGIIKSYEYYMVDYILTEDPTIGYKEALEMSRKMMDGNKWETFVLELSFLGWIILSCCTCYILSIFYVNPYIYATYSELFLTLRSNYFGPTVQPYYTPSYAGAGGYGNQNFNASGYDQSYNTQASYGVPYDPRNSYDQAGQTGYGQTGYDQTGYRQTGYDQTDYGQTGYGQSSGSSDSVISLKKEDSSSDGQAYNPDSNYTDPNAGYTDPNAGYSNFGDTSDPNQTYTDNNDPYNPQ